MQQLYNRNQIINKHNQFIAYWSKQPGNTEFEKFKNLNLSNMDNYNLCDKNGNNVICFISSLKAGLEDGYNIVCFNHLGETILNSNDCCENSKYGVQESLNDYMI